MKHFLVDLVRVGEGQLGLVVTHLLQVGDAELVHGRLQLLTLDFPVKLCSEINKAVLPA